MSDTLTGARGEGEWARGAHVRWTKEPGRWRSAAGGGWVSPKSGQWRKGSAGPEQDPAKLEWVPT